ncbi:MAG: TldD/PmbA family protein [Bacilli bacterium]|nr:TldD/PmbA family protein [Bacilli bacterium]
MNFNKFFALAKERGISESQIQIGRSSSTSIKLYHGEIENLTISESQGVTACGIYNGKFGSARTDKLDKDTFEYLVSQIIVSASFSEKEGEAELFKGSEKYHKRNMYNPVLAETPLSEKIAKMHELEEVAFAYDKRISEVEEVDYEETTSSSEFYNSYGLKLKQKSNYFVYVIAVVAKEGEDVKTAYKVHLGDDFSKFDAKATVKTVCDEAIAKFGAAPCASKKYPTVLHSDIVASLAAYFLESASSDEVQRKSSFLIGKIGQKIASSKLTIEEKPLTKNIFFSYFDDEGVATYNKTIVKKGVLQGYFYNRETAKKDGVESTGNGQWAGSKIGIGFGNIFIKPGKKTFEEMISPIKEGVYITDIAGLGTGMNPQSGDFSCQAQGFMIRDGKVAEPLTLITISGNLLKLFSDLKEFSNRVELKNSSISVADAYIKKLSIGGK